MRGRERYRRQWSQSAMPLALEIVEAVFSSILVESSLPSPSLLLRQGFTLKEQKKVYTTVYGTENPCACRPTGMKGPLLLLLLMLGTRLVPMEATISFLELTNYTRSF